MKHYLKNFQKGFTLVELIIVVAILGILAAVGTSWVQRIQEKTTATAISDGVKTTHSAWANINRSCNTSNVISGNVIPAAGKTVGDVLVGGVANVAAAYQTCYTASGVATLQEVLQPTSTSGVYAIAGYTLTMAGGGSSAPVQYSLASVQDEVVLPLAQIYNPQLSALAASDSTSNVVQYGTVTAGMRTATMLKK